MAISKNERREMAEEWRVLGEKLRERSPHAFENLIAMITTSALAGEPESESEIDSVYLIH